MTRTWRNRTPRTGAVLMATLLLGACGSPTDPADASPEEYVESATITAEAEQAYGDQADAAYDELAAFSLEEWLVPEVLDPQTPDPTAEQLSDGITGHLTAETATEWEQTVTSAVGGDTAAQEDASILRLYTLSAPTLALPSDGDLVESQAIVDGTVDVGTAGEDGVVPLVVSFVHQADVELRDGRVPVDVALARTVEFTVVPSASAAGQGQTTSPDTAAATDAATDTTVDPDVSWLVSTFTGEIATAQDTEQEGTSTATPTTTSS